MSLSISLVMSIFLLSLREMMTSMLYLGDPSEVDPSSQLLSGEGFFLDLFDFLWSGSRNDLVA